MPALGEQPRCHEDQVDDAHQRQGQTEGAELEEAQTGVASRAQHAVGDEIRGGSDERAHSTKKGRVG